MLNPVTERHRAAGGRGGKEVEKIRERQKGVESCRRRGERKDSSVRRGGDQGHCQIIPFHSTLAKTFLLLPKGPHTTTAAFFQLLNNEDMGREFLL